MMPRRFILHLLTMCMCLCVSCVLLLAVCSLLQHLMKRIQRGPVRGISLKLQEEERERRLDYVPVVSAITIDSIDVDQDTKDMLGALNIRLAQVNVVSVRP